MEHLYFILLASSLIAGGILLIVFGNKKQNKTMTILGWIITIATTIASIVGIILYHELGEYSFAISLLVVAGPGIIVVGFIVTLGLSIANLVKGYEKDANGNRNQSKIIAGWALLILAILLILAVVIPLTFIFDQQSSSSANNIRFM